MSFRSFFIDSSSWKPGSDSGTLLASNHEQRQAETLKHSQMSPLGEIHRHLEDQDLTLLTHTISGVISDQRWQELVDRKAFA